MFSHFFTKNFKVKNIFRKIFIFFFFNTFIFTFTCWDCEFLELFFGGAQEKKVDTTAEGEKNKENGYVFTETRNECFEMISNQVGKYSKKRISSISEPDEFCSNLQKSEVVFLGECCAIGDSVKFDSNFIATLKKDNDLDIMDGEKNMKDLLRVMVFYFNTKVTRERIPTSKKLSNIEQIEFAIRKKMEEDGRYNVMSLWLFGVEKVGKTSIFNQFTKKEKIKNNHKEINKEKSFDSDQNLPTMPSSASFNDNSEVATLEMYFPHYWDYRIQIIDMYNEKFLNLYTIPNNAVCLLVYNVAKRESFNRLTKIIQYFSKDGKKHLFFIIGNNFNLSDKLKKTEEEGNIIPEGEIYKQVEEWNKMLSNNEEINIESDGEKNVE